jgi:4a-hydroxytetrahydrobiopterin dehydratase
MNLRDKKCVPCEKGTKPLSSEEENYYLRALSTWRINREDVHKISRTYTFKGFSDAISFVNRIAHVAEDEGHHPGITITYNKVLIELYTHAIGGLSMNDFIMALKIENL